MTARIVVAGVVAGLLADVVPVVLVDLVMAVAVLGGGRRTKYEYGIVQSTTTATTRR
jgi:hypothetical protein